LTDLLSTNDAIDREWLTAKVADPHVVRRCLGRLDVNGYEYRVVFDDRQLRILVRRIVLDEVLQLLADLSSGSFHVRGSRRCNQGRHLRLLAAIPLGAAIGSTLSALLGVPVENGTTISAICACLAAFIAACCQPACMLIPRFFANDEPAEFSEPIE
jgi:hypothetical protein